MIDKYIILNRKTNFIIKLFIFNITFLIIAIIWCINTCYYQSFFHIHSQILEINSFYYLEVLIPVKEVNKIAKQNKIIIESKEYNYQISKIDPNIIYQNDNNYQKVYLEVFNLLEDYQKNGYRIKVKIPKENKKILQYLKE